MHLNARARPPDLAIVIVSTNEAHWLERCLPTVFERAGRRALDVIVVDNASSDGTRDARGVGLPRTPAWSARPNRGFAYGNNRGLKPPARATSCY